MKRLALPLLLAATLAACTTPTVFGPAAGPAGVGYAETRIQADRWRVTFRGGSDAEPDRVADLALLRAGQLTLEQGYDWFRVIEGYQSALPPRGPFLSVGGGTTSYRRYGGTGLGVGVGAAGIPLGGDAMISQTIEIVMGKGKRPDEPDAYDARDVAASVKP